MPELLTPERRACMICVYVARVSLDRRPATGRLGERLAARHLEHDGYRVVDRNYRTRAGEIDLVAVCGRTLVFCEVKTLVRRSGLGPGPVHPLESVRPAQRVRIRRLATSWLSENRAVVRSSGRPDLRFDAIGVLLSPAGELIELEHVRAAF